MVFYQSDLPATFEKWLNHYDCTVSATSLPWQTVHQRLKLGTVEPDLQTAMSAKPEPIGRLGAMRSNPEAHHQVVGKAQSAVGKLFGDSKLQAEVAGRRASGQLAQAYGDAMDSVAAFVKEKRVAAAAIGGIALLILDRLFRR